MVAEFRRNLDGNVAHVGNVIDAEEATASLFAQFIEKDRPHSLLCGGGVGVKNADGVDFDVRLAHLGFDFALGITGPVVAPVGDDEQSFALLAGILHFVQSKIDGIEQGGAMTRADCRESGFDIFDGTSEVFNELGAVVEADDKEFILRIGGLHELDDGVPGSDEFGGHGAGEVHDDADGDGGIFRGEGTDFLHRVVFVDEEVVLFESRNQSVHGVGDGHGDEDKVYVSPDTFAGADLEGIGAADGGCFGTCGCACGRGGCSAWRRNVYLIELVVLGPGRGAEQGQDENDSNQGGAGKNLPDFGE